MSKKGYKSSLPPHIEPEKWKIITNYPDYKISSHGRVKSLRRLVKKKNCDVLFPTKILFQFLRSGYKSVNLYVDKKYKTHSVHRLVGKHFVDNPDPKNKTHVNHLDTDKLNNYYKNLRWDTPLENTQHAIKNNVFSLPPQGEKNGQAILTEENVRYIRNTRRIVARILLAKQFGVSVKHIDRVRGGERWGHLL